MLGGATYVGFIPVRDIAAAKGFYVDQLGLRLLEDTPFALVVDAGGTTVRITPVGEFTPFPFTIAGWGVADIEAAVRALPVPTNRYDGMDQDQLGIWTAPGGAGVAWFCDPDGNTLSLSALAP